MIERIEQGTLPHGKKAVIALTSWKKRINTVGLTIYNLFTMCGPEFHIVLTLAEEEFPRKERELPRDLILMNRGGVFEVLWVKKNWMSFKKWAFCAKRYPNVPTISADDDCLYTCNYANRLYSMWETSKSSIITNDGMPDTKYGIPWGRGPNTLYPPGFYQYIVNDTMLNKIAGLIHLDITEDDSLYGIIAKHHGINIIDIQQERFYIFHDAINGLSDNPFINFSQAISIYKTILK